MRKECVKTWIRELRHVIFDDYEIKSVITVENKPPDIYERALEMTHRVIFYEITRDEKDLGKNEYSLKCANNLVSV